MRLCHCERKTGSEQEEAGQEGDPVARISFSGTSRLVSPKVGLRRKIEFALAPLGGPTQVALTENGMLFNVHGTIQTDLGKDAVLSALSPTLRGLQVQEVAEALQKEPKDGTNRST